MAPPKKLDKKAKAKADFEKTQAVATVKKSAKETDADLEKYLDVFKGMIGDINKPLEFIPSGSWIFDRCIGDGTGTGAPGGIPRGFMGELYGKESCGKTTLALQACREAQRMGLRVLYADFEKSLRGQRNYVKNIGVDIDDKKKFIHIEPSCYEDGAKAVLTAMLVFKPGLIVIDSLATAIPRAFLKGNLDEAAQVGLHAKLTTTFIGNLNAHLKEANSAIIVINQFRSNIKKDQYEEGPKEITTGGLASKYAYMWRCELKPTSDKEEVIGISDTTGIKEAKLTNQKVKLIMVKNKIDKPFRSSFVYITFGVGIDGIRSVQALAENKGLIKAKGAWYGYVSKTDPTLSFNLAGRPAVTSYLKAHPEIVNDMKPQLFPQIDSEEYLAAKESGALAENGENEEEELTPEQKAAIASMESSMDEASSSMKLPNED